MCPIERLNQHNDCRQRLVVVHGVGSVYAVAHRLSLPDPQGKSLGTHKPLQTTCQLLPHGKQWRPVQRTVSQTLTDGRLHKVCQVTLYVTVFTAKLP